MNGVCPCCGQSVTEAETLLVSLDTNAASRLGNVVQLEPRMAELLFALRERFPKPLTMAGAIKALVGIGREPRNVETLVKVQISRLRRALAPLGVMIETRYTAGWRLVFRDTPLTWKPMKRARLAV